MTTKQSGMYTIHDDTHDWTAFVITTIIGDGNREHGWYADGATEDEAIQELQEEMREVPG